MAHSIADMTATLTGLLLACCGFVVLVMHTSYLSEGHVSSGNPSPSPSQNVPLILIPGLTGSALEVKLHGTQMPHFLCSQDTRGEWTKVWVDPAEVLPHMIDCLTAKLTLIFNETDESYSNMPGVELRPVGVDSEKGMDWIYRYEFGDMISHLGKTLDYKLGTDLFIAPYDWRLTGGSHARATNGVGGFYEELKLLIETSVKESGRKVILLTHSLGCPTTLYFFNVYVTESWQAANIHGWVALAGPWMGSSVQASAYLGGWTLGLPSWLVPRNAVRQIQVNASSGVWLSPHPKAFGDQIIVRTPSRNYTSADIPHLISVIGQSSGGNQALAMFRLKSTDLAAIQHAPANVPMLNWYAIGVPTPVSYVYGSDIGPGFGEFPKATVNEDGDGIVNIISLRHVEKHWPQTSSVSTRIFPNTSHFGILKDARVIEALTEYLQSSRGCQSSTPVQTPGEAALSWLL